MKSGLPEEVRSLMQRFAQLGQLLPANMDDLNTDDPAAVAEVRAIVAEMGKTKAELDALLDKARKDRKSMGVRL